MWWEFFDKKIGWNLAIFKRKKEKYYDKIFLFYFILFILVKFIVPDWWSLRTELNQAHYRCFSESSYIVATH